MKILLIGHSIIDNYKADEKGSKFPGGIFYSSMGINAMRKPDDELYLLTKISKKSFQLFVSQYNHVDNRYFLNGDDVPEVILEIPAEGERIETYKNVSSKLDISVVDDWNQFDGVLINMITGFDLNLEQLMHIRKEFNNTIFLDIHTLARGLNSDFKREFRPIPDIEKWLKNIDILQCNDNEIRTITDKPTEAEKAEFILSAGVKILLITKAEKGAVCYIKEGNAVKRYCENSIKIKVENKIGCGDIFGAVFFYSYISTRDCMTSLRLANRAGAGAASVKNLISEFTFE